MDVRHDTEGKRFVAELPGGEGELAYRDGEAGTIDLVHTEVDPALQGKGVGDALVRAALDYAKAHDLRVVPSCPYVKKWLDKHPDVRDSLPS